VVRPGPTGEVGPVGVLALQGDFREHLSLLASLGVAAIPVRLPSQLEQVSALVVPGGESTTISLLLESSGLLGPLRERLRLGLPTLGTCAGMILLAEEVLDGRPDQHCLGAIDISVRRNAFGRQRESFEADLAVDGLRAPLHAVFIRAPVVERVGDGVEVLASVVLPDGGEKPVVCRQGNVLVCSFHPELAGDPRLHEAFLGLVPEKLSADKETAEKLSADKERPDKERPDKERPDKERTGNVRAL
jgi:5'-phosphate synthase pdxT subunit